MVKELKFKATLSGDSEVPPVLTQATGCAELTYNTLTKIISWKIKISGLTSKIDPTISGGLHIHKGATGVNGPIIVTLNKLCGSACFPSENLIDLLAGNTYINVHTKDHPSGELRGQIVKKHEIYDLCDLYGILSNKCYYEYYDRCYDECYYKRYNKCYDRYYDRCDDRCYDRCDCCDCC